MFPIPFSTLSFWLFFSQLLKHQSANEKKKSAPPPVWKSWTLRQNRHKLDIAPLLRWINNGRLWLAIEEQRWELCRPHFQYAWCKTSGKEIPKLFNSPFEHQAKIYLTLVKIYHNISWKVNQSLFHFEKMLLKEKHVFISDTHQQTTFSNAIQSGWTMYSI